MSRVIFLGNQAGVAKGVEVIHNAKRVRQTLAGDTNSLYNYSLFCGCNEGKTELGVIARFKANEGGQRSVVCPVCKNVTLLDRDLQIMKVLPLATVLQNIQPH